MILLSYNSINDTYSVLVSEYEEVTKGCFIVKNQKIQEVSSQYLKSLKNEIRFEEQLKQLTGGDNDK